eukprot:2544671-Amphidinium_carterae.1
MFLGHWWARLVIIGWRWDRQRHYWSKMKWVISGTIVFPGRRLGSVAQMPTPTGGILRLLNSPINLFHTPRPAPIDAPDGLR